MEHDWTLLARTAAGAKTVEGPLAGRTAVLNGILWIYFRGIVVRYERFVENFLGMLHPVPWKRDASHNSRAGHPVWRRCSSLTYAQ